MTIYYVSPTGDDSLDDSGNSESTPYATVGRAELVCSTDDTIQLSGGTATSPLRSGIDQTNGPLPAAVTDLTYQGPCVLSNAVSLTEGDYILDQLATRYCLDLAEWINESANVSIVADASYMGGSATLFDGTAGPATESAYIDFEGANKVRITVRYKAITGSWTWRLKNNSTANWYNSGTEVWGGVNNNTGGSATSLTEVSFDVTLESGTSQLYFYFYATSGNSAVCDRVTFAHKVEWDTTSTPWELKWLRPNTVTNEKLFKCTQASWDADGYDAFDVSHPAVTKSDNIGAIVAGQYYFAGANTYLLSYDPLGGEVIGDLHFEISNFFDNKIDQICNILDITATGGYSGFTISAAALLENVDGVRGIFTKAFSITAGAPVLTSCTMSGIYGDPTGVGVHGEGCISIGSSTPKLVGCHGEDIHDEIYQPAGLSYMTLWGCTGIASNIDEGNVFESNFTDNQGAGAAGFDLYNCTFKNDYGGQNCFKVEDDGTTTITGNINGCIFEESNKVQGPVAIASTNITLTTAANNTITGTYTGDAVTWVGKDAATGLTDFGGTEVSVANAGVNTDLSLTETSTLLGTGVKWWGTGPRPVSAQGEPYPDTEIDAGGVQSTWDADHPANL